MPPLVLRAKDVEILLRCCRTESYRIVSEIKNLYPFSQQLRGAKIRTQDFADSYDFQMTSIAEALKEV